MHELFVAVLQRKDLSKAGDLFSLEDAYIVEDIPQVFNIIQGIITQPNFLSNHNDQSLVEICITRLTSAIRETRTIEDHAECLVNLLETCLGYNLRPMNGGPDPPHAKFASDVMSCIFLNYGKRNVMELALPVSVKFLHKGNKELSRNMSSYLSLAAIENAQLLAQHIQPIIDSVISGNYSLARVLPQIYSVNRDPIKNHVMTLVSILPNCENTEILALLSLFSLIAKDSPAHLEPSIPQLCECLSSPTIAQATLQVFYNMSLHRPQPLADHTDQFKRATETSPKSALLSIQLLSIIAKAKQEKAQETLDFILSVIGRMESEKHSLVLKEIISLTTKYPHLLSASLINKVSSLDEGGATSATKTAIQELKNEFNHQFSKNQLEKLTINTRYHPPNVTSLPVSHIHSNNNHSKNNFNINNQQQHQNGSNCQIGSNTNAVTVVKVGGGDSRPELSSQSRNNLAPSSSVITTTVPWTTSAIASGSRPDIQHATSGSNKDILFYGPSSSRDITAYLNQRDILSNVTSSGRDVLTNSSGNNRSDVLSQTPGHSRDVLSQTPSSSRDMLSNTPTSSRDVLSYAPTNSRDILSYPSSSRNVPSHYVPTSSAASSVARELYGTSVAKELYGTGVARELYGSALGGRDILSHDTANAAAQNAATQKASVVASRSASRLPTHRSMTKLNSNVASNAGLDNKIGLHKSMSRLNTSQQNMARFSSSSQTVVPSSAVTMGARSITCITGSRTTPNVVGSHYPPTYTHHGHFSTARVTVSTSGGPGGGGTASPTKSMSSGSMSMDPNSCREVLTVNVNQINQDLIRQVSSVLSHHDIHNLLLPTSATSTAMQQSQLPNSAYSSHHVVSSSGPGTSVYNVQSAAPFSLPSHASRRVPTYSSGPLPTPSSSSQPPSLGIPLSPAVPPPPGPQHLFPLPNFVEPSLKSCHISSQPLTSGSGGPNSTATTRKNPRKNSNPNISTRGFSNTLPSPRRRHLADVVGDEEPDNGADGQADALYRTTAPLRSDSDTISANRNNRVSVFEPYPMRDTVQHFCEKHLDKIKSYMESLCVKLPLPVKCTIEERKGRKHAKLHFACQGRTGEHCLYKVTLYTMKTRNPRTWIHLMFLALQARSTAAISTRETSVSALKNCWDILKCENISFVTLVTGAFPPAKAQDYLLHELRSHRFFDVFEYNGPLKLWGCFLCNHPDRANNFITEEEPVIEGQLKEKKSGKWKLFRRWKSRYFTLSGARLTYKDVANGEPGVVTQSLDVGSIRSVKVSKEGRRNIPKAFEIFTADKTFILKAKDGSNAQEWVQCLSVAKAHNQAKDNSLRKLAYGGSLGRLNNHHGRVPLHHHPLNSNMALRTNV